MKCYGLWYGGSSYSVPRIHEDLESFKSLKQAMLVLYRRYVNTNNYTPAVDSETCEIAIYFDKDNLDYPDRIIDFGPKMGIRCYKV